jgi:hypothetical protein
MAEVIKKVKKEVDVVVDILCDCCGKSCRGKHGDYEYMELNASWGYGTNKDLEKWTAKVCETCVDEKFKTMINFQVMDFMINSSMKE